MSGANYDLTAYQQQRQAIAAENQANTQAYEQSAMMWDQQAAAIIRANEESGGEQIPIPTDPEPPEMYEELPALPPAFDPKLMPEMEGAKSFAEVMERIDKKVETMHTHLKNIRTTKYEDDWTRIEAAFNMDDGMREDLLRNASVNMMDDDRSDVEKGRWRLGQSLPLVFEACEHIYSRLYMNVRGNAQDYCDIKGREKNDIPGAKRAVSFLNYQYSHEIQTDEELSDWCYDAAKLGTGFMFQYWQGNKRIMESISPWNIWIDNARNIEKCACAIIRKMATVGELTAMRAAGLVWFTDSDMEAAANKKVDYTGPGTTYGGYASKRMLELSQTTEKKADIDPYYQKVAVDTFMDTANKRWIVRVNESIVIAVHPAMLEGRLPISVLTPRRRGRELYGDSDLIRTLDLQDMANAIMEVGIENIKKSSNPAYIGSDADLANQRITPGYYHYTQNPRDVQPLMPPNATQQIFFAIDWIRQNAIDRASGVNDTMRGQAQYSGMTATATRDLSMQAGNRMAPQDDMAIAAMVDVNTVALELCQMYLQPHEAFQVVGEQWLPVPMGAEMQNARPIEGNDLFGIVGKDLVPTGSPGTPVGLAQEYLNFATVAAQMGGNPQPIMREYARVAFEGRINPDDVFPENHIGNDPMQENENLMQGAPISRDPDDNDARHLQVHQMLMQDKAFMQMANMNPMLGMALMAHVQEHFAFAQRQAAMMAGAPMPEGRGSGQGGAGMGAEQLLEPDVKEDSEREAQMEAQQS